MGGDKDGHALHAIVTPSAFRARQSFIFIIIVASL